MKFKIERNRIYQEDEAGQVIAEITFPETTPGVFVIYHTFVDSSLRGQGIASKLVQTAVDEIKKRERTEASLVLAMTAEERSKEQSDKFFLSVDTFLNMIQPFHVIIHYEVIKLAVMAVYCAAVRVTSGFNVKKFMEKAAPAMLTSVSIMSSKTAVPVNMAACKKLGVPSNVYNISVLIKRSLIS